MDSFVIRRPKADANPESVLKKVFRLDAFRGEQRRIIESVLARRDVLVLMPTGGGKSLIYQLPAVISPGLTLVVSPLIALIVTSSNVAEPSRCAQEPRRQRCSSAFDAQSKREITDPDAAQKQRVRARYPLCHARAARHRPIQNTNDPHHQRKTTRPTSH